MENKKRYLLIILGIILISILGTFAWLTWKSKDTSLVLTIGDISGTTVTLKPYVVEQSLIPTLTYEGNESINVTAKNNGTTENDIVLYYKINNISEELITDSFKYTVLKSIDNGRTYEEYQTGNFASSVSGEELVILTETIPANTTYKYRVYTWLDGENETSSNIQGKSFKAELRASIFNGSVVTVDVPSGLIPVTIANDGTVTSISKEDSSWYDYNNKLWANGVLVTESSRSTYLGTTGVEIPESDILAYYVYVPRYKYKIWTTGTSGTGQEQEIEILFENVNISKSKGSKVGEYLTHPAFTFGETELNGIWVGKFETTGTEGNPTIKSNAKSLTSQNISTQFQTSLKFAGGTLNNGTTSFIGNNIYGLNNKVDSHMAKNTEWAAAAYLSHSKYGINTEVRLNNYYNNGYKTGCGASKENGETNTTCEITYGESQTYPQSTTGNISGVFDMSGGAYENVMGVLANSVGILWSGNSTSENSGFNGLLGNDGTAYTSGIDFPEKKYYEVYKASSGTTIDSLTACNGSYCYGHALSEVYSWYETSARFVSSEKPWFNYGGYYGRPYTGIFLFSTYYGNIDNNNSFRSILIANPQENMLNLSVDLNGGTSTQNLAGIYPANKQINLVNPTRSGYTFDGWEVTNGDGVILTNLITNGSFEDGATGWSYRRRYISDNSLSGTAVTTKSSTGSKSMYIKDTSTTASYWQYQYFNTELNHKIYVRLKTNIISGNYRLAVDNDENNVIFSQSIVNSPYFMVSSKIYTSTSKEQFLQVGSSGGNVSEGYVDDIAVIDLTKIYGAGNEPTQEWLDKNINYFDKYAIYLNKQNTTIRAKWKKNITLSINLNGGTSTQKFNTEYSPNTFLSLTIPTRSGYTFAGWKVTNGDGVTLTNLITNGSFENNAINWSKYRVTTPTNDLYGTVVTTKSSTGSKSMYINDTSTTASYWQYQYFNTELNHKIYVQAKTNIISGKHSIGVDGGEGKSIFYEQITTSTYFKLYSKLYTNTYTGQFLQVGSGSSNVSEGYVDDIVVIDLTKIYGAGNEPTQEWLDKNINYFDKYAIYLNSQNTKVEALWST